MPLSAGGKLGPREIHIEQAVPIADLTVHPGAVTPKGLTPDWQELVHSAYFVTELVSLKAGVSTLPAAANTQLWICLEGRGTIAGQPFGQGDVWLMPDPATVEAGATARFLRTFVPD